MRLRLKAAALLLLLSWLPANLQAGPPGPMGRSVSIRLDTASAGPEIPYNLRVIDQTLFAGGSLFDPQTHSRPIEQVRQQLRFLKGSGVRTVVILNVPAREDADLRTERTLCREEGLRFLPVRMTADLVPDAQQTAAILAAIRRGAYVHCQWGADRTGAVIARYLRDVKGYSGEAALRAIQTGGSHTGRRGGFKIKPFNRKLVLYFWPEVIRESRETCDTYGIPIQGIPTN